MPKDKLKVVLLTHGGAERFLELLSPEVEIVGIFIETATERRRGLIDKIRRSFRYDGFLGTIRKLLKNKPEHKGIRNDLATWAEERNLPVVEVENYHSENAISLIRETNADLGILYGTNIIRESVFSIPRLGSINLHQGLAPYYRGGPTVFWELLNGEKEVGITVHFVAAAVDTGDIILQQTVPLEYDFSKYGLNYDDFLEDFRASMKEPAARLMADAVRQIAAGEEQRAKQDTSLGKRYRIPVKSEKERLLNVLKTRQIAAGKLTKRPIFQ